MLKKGVCALPVAVSSTAANWADTVRLKEAAPISANILAEKLDQASADINPTVLVVARNQGARIHQDPASFLRTEAGSGLDKP